MEVEMVMRVGLGMDMGMERETGVEMGMARRLWYWEGAASLSQLCMEGDNER